MTRAAQQLVATERHEHPDSGVTLLLPRRAYGPLERLLHDRTADKIAKAVSRTPGAAATIVPYDVHSQVRKATPNKVEQWIARAFAAIEVRVRRGETQKVASYEHPERRTTATAMNKLTAGRSATVEGRVSEVEDVIKRGRTVRSMVVGDDSGQVRVTFRPGDAGADIVPGQVLRITGETRRNENDEAISMADPAFQVVD